MTQVRVYRIGVRMFNDKGYEVRKKVLSKQTCEIIHEYYKIKIQNNEFHFDNGEQVKDTINMYGNPLNDAIMKWTTSIAEEMVGEELYPCYTFMRVYNRNDELDPHTDRPSCEFSATLPIYCDEPWPIFMQKYDEKEYGKIGENADYHLAAVKGESKGVLLHRGDMCFYEGTKMNHWRRRFRGSQAFQLFIHYVRKNGEYSDYKFDKRENLGMKSHSEKNAWNHLFDD